jgi:hypothetical protein
MISTVSLSFDLTHTNPGTGALQPRGVIVDSTDYIGLGLDPIIYELKGLGQVTFNGDIIVDGNLISNPIIDLQDWNFVDDGVPTAYFDLPLDLNGNVANGVYTFVYKLRVNSFTIPVAATITPPDLVNVASNQWITQYLEVGNVIRLADPGVDFEDVTVEALNQAGANAEITVTDYTIPLVEIITFDLENVQLNGVYTYTGCTQVDADVSFTYDCEYGDSGTWGVSNTTPLASNEVVANLSCSINYPSWTTLSPTFPGNIVTSSLPYPPPGTETPLATGTYSVSLTQQIQQTQTSGLVVLYTKSVVKEFQVSCAGSLCGLTPCIENLRAAHAVELQRNRISKYQVFVDNVLLYYAEAQNYRACGDTANYRATLELIKQNLDSSGCECACCDDNTYYWVSNNSGDSVIESLIRSFQFRLFSLTPAGPGSPLASDDETQGVEVGALWQNTNTGIIYRCTVNTAEAAVWVEYYAPGTLPIASDVPATPNLPFLSSNNVQNQLGQANTQFAAQLLANAQFNADITAVENSVAALDGVNGLTRTGDDFALGGALTGNTTINTTTFNFKLSTSENVAPLLIESAGTVAGMSIRKTTTNPTTVNVTDITRVYSPSGGNGLGARFETYLSDVTGVEALASFAITYWGDSTNKDSFYELGTSNGGSTSTRLTILPDGQLRLNNYSTANFPDPAPVYSLGVDASGNVVQTTASSGPLVYVARMFQSGTAAPVVAEIANTTGATFTYTRNGLGDYTLTASDAVFTSGKTAVFLTAGNSGATSNAYMATAFISGLFTCRFGSATGFFSGGADDLLKGATLKIEIYP